MGNFFTDLFSTKPAEKAAQDKIAGLNQGYNDASGSINTGLGVANNLYDQAFLPMQSLYGQGSDAYSKYSGAYGDATGVNGADGIGRATAAYQSMPGYQGGLDTGVKTLEARAAARGDLGGGNTSADTLKFASDYDASHYGDYMRGLSGGLSSGQSLMTTGAAGESGIRSGQAGANLGAYGQLANYGWQKGTGIGNANADADMAAYNASGNFWSALMGGANMGLKASGWGGFGAKGK